MDYRFENDEFVIDNYNLKPPFSSFLPGICGADGVPLWCCYVNRGQAAASFGADRRDGAIMEFVPAVQAYEDTARKGFRTFLRTGGKIWEPFAPSGAGKCAQTMRVAQNRFSLCETGCASGVDTRADCFLLSHERLGALVRRVTVKNTTAQPLEFELLDGMARVLPYGVRNSEFRQMANLLLSFFETRRTAAGAALFSMRASSDNDARVSEIARAHFCFASMDGKALPLVCDPAAVFGQDTGYDSPGEFLSRGAGVIGSRRAECNKIPCAFAAARLSLAPMESGTIYFVSGIANSEAELDDYAPLLCSPVWMDKKLQEADVLTRELTSAMETHTSSPVFDLYLRQCWLDNVMRGGQPLLLGDKLLHLYSRRHGDMERDYNDFALSATHFSEGDGNFRDVCQNRRSDVMFFPAVGSREVKRFAELLQLDGYNPLELSASRWVLSAENEEPFFELCGETFADRAAARVLAEALRTGLAAGDIWRALDARGVVLERETETRFFTRLSALCGEQPRAVFGDGYWIDHWTYVPDLIDSFARMFPERESELLFFEPVRYFAACAHVRPLREKLRRTPGGPRQYDAVERARMRSGIAWETDADGELLTSSLFAKLLLLCALKCAALDPEQLGLEMEAGKPGWNDALNGLPGLFGSSVSECADLALLIRRLSVWVKEMDSVSVPRAVWELTAELERTVSALQAGDISRFGFWRQALALREAWRERAYSGFSSGEWSEVSVSGQSVLSSLRRLGHLVSDGIARGEAAGSPPPTYFVFKPEFSGGAEDFEHLSGFGSRPLPVFLEGPAKLLRLRRGEDAVALYETIRNSGLYDKRLKMYKTCDSLEGETMELGRIRAFTSGWFERESIFPHAEYKFLLALLRAGACDEFFDEARRLLVPFLDPEAYGRSTVENSSFLASGANPDPSLCGRGYVARLSGATAEMISMWLEMFLGGRAFNIRNGDVVFTLAPKLPGWLFDADGRICFNYLGCRFEYLNPARADTWAACARLSHMTADGETVYGDTLPAHLALRLREGKLASLRASFSA